MPGSEREITHHTRSAFLAGVAFTVAACGGTDPTQPAAQAPGIKLVAGGSVTDTIGAQFAQALIVEVRRPDGAPARGAVVRFEAQRAADSTRRFESAIFACAVTAASCGGYLGLQNFVADTADSAGRARVIVRLGTVAGAAIIRLNVPEYGFIDSVSFVVRTGAPAAVVAPTATVALDIGASTPIAAKVVDRAGNARPEAPTYAALSGTALRVDPATGVTTALDMGTQSIVARYTTFADTVVATVVPGGRLVVWSPITREIRMVNTNGSGNRLLLTDIASDLGTFPSFDSGRQRILMHKGSASYGGQSNSMVLIDTIGTPRRDIGPFPSISNVLAQRRLDDGTVRVVGLSSDGALWSIAADNSLTRIATLPSLAFTYAAADISPDGNRVAYLVQSASFTYELRVLNVLTGAITTIAASARSPRWSPTGNQLAWLTSGSGFGELDGVVTVANADGTATRNLGSAVYSPGLAWSPDGAYIIGRSNSVLRIVRVRDLESIVLNLSQPDTYTDYYQPDWR